MRISLPLPRRAGRSRGLGRQTWLLAPLALAVIAGVIFWRLQAGAATTPTTTTATVSQGTLTVSVSGSGAVSAARTVQLAFQQAGTVSAVNVKVGDQVRAGQVLAAIDSGDLELALRQAEAGLKAAQASYDAALGGSPTEQDLATAQAQLASAEAQLAQTRAGSATAADITSAQAQLDSARARLQALTSPAASDLAAAQAAVDKAQLALQSARDSASQQKTNAEIALKNAVNSLTQAQVAYATAKGNWDFVQETGQDPTNPESTDASGRVVRNKLNDTQRQQYYDTFARAEAQLNSAENAVTQAQVAFDAARQSEVIQIAEAEAAVADAQRQLDALKSPSASDLAEARAAVAQAQASLDKLREGPTDAELAQAEAGVTQAQASLDRLTAPAAAPELAQAEASLLQAQVALETARRNLEEASLTAPFDGVVSAVSVAQSSQVGAGTAGVTLIDRSTLHIEVSLSETDAARVEVGQPATLTFDAVPDVTLSGAVETVAPSAATEQNVVTYPVQIAFDPGDAPVRVGMSATAEITVQQVDDAILVPSRAVQTSGGAKSVTLLTGADRAPVMVAVTTGASADGQTVITGCVDTGARCLQPGDTLAVARTTSTTTSSAQSGGMGGFGGFGGPPPGR